jgi:transposase-like protein
VEPGQPELGADSLPATRRASEHRELARSGAGSESGGAQPKIEVTTKRRTFSTAYKVKIVEQAEVCQELGEIGALLRRDGLYSSHLSNWRAQYRAGGKAALKTATRGPKRKRNALQDELDAITRERDKLTRQLEQAQLIIEIQKKVASILTHGQSEGDKQ